MCSAAAMARLLVLRRGDDDGRPRFLLRPERELELCRASLGARAPRPPSSALEPERAATTSCCPPARLLRHPLPSTAARAGWGAGPAADATSVIEELLYLRYE
ncbi:hypothetical protein PVAP13_3NG085201 [Panicum virgatum]|uniref:Uncharacterized protein n=1 Tax=Panicum virgatum TaxID=38727 RepID=A0A8T0UAZ9_PANVG|nr:hypothetical protein PVAP13_3NG085201 [Panicum virgatum]